jgi:hypothetical protein
MHENERGAAAAVGTNKYWREQSRSSLYGWLAVSSERRVLLAGCWWLFCSERKVLLAGG